MAMTTMEPGQRVKIVKCRSGTHDGMTGSINDPACDDVEPTIKIDATWGYGLYCHEVVELDAEEEAILVAQGGRIQKNVDSILTSPSPPVPRLSRTDALAQAMVHVESMCVAPKDGKGYVRSGWTDPTLAEREAAVLAFAAFLLGESS